MKLGIDIGGTSINIGAVKAGKLVSASSYPSFADNCTLEETFEHLFSIIDRHIADTDSIGIGVPSVVDVEKGIVYDTANIPSWKEVHLGSELEKRYNVPVSINNDANCFTIGAAEICGNGPKGIFVGVTLGTGVGIGVINDGKIINGANTGYGELTWLPYEGRPIEYWCGKHYFLDLGATPAEFCSRAEKGDSEALETLRQYGRNLANLLNIVISAYDPHMIVFGGGISNARGFFEESMMQRLKETFPFPKSLEKLEIKYLPQSDAAILGASLL